MRDAFKALESEDLLEVRPHIGTFVSYIDLNKVSDMIFMRESLEQTVLRILTNSCTQSQILKIRLLLKEQENEESVWGDEAPRGDRPGYVK